MPLEPDLFGDLYFGYQCCGLVQRDEFKTHFVFGLNPKHIRSITRTLHVLFRILLVYIGDGKSNSDQKQMIEVRTSADDNSMGYGHAVGGYVFHDVFSWLQTYAKTHKVSAWGRAALPSAVIDAMQETWKSLVPKGLHDWRRECRADVSQDGGFNLTCFGGASDVAIYPDQIARFMDFETGEERVEFSCHNLDCADQQLILLSGLAKLCEIVREDIECKAKRNS